MEQRERIRTPGPAGSMIECDMELFLEVKSLVVAEMRARGLEGWPALDIAVCEAMPQALAQRLFGAPIGATVN